MKMLKLSKTSWLILSAGIFLVVLGSLGVTRSQQLKEKSKLDEDLRSSTIVMDKIQTDTLQQQLDDLQQRAEEGEVLLNEARERLNQTVVSVDVSEELFAIAEYCGVTVVTIGTTPIKPNKFEDVGLDMTSMSITALGDLASLVNFVSSLNDDYTTGLVKSFQISIPDSSDESESPSINIQMTIFSYEGINNG
jgi:hypothetical protein